MAPRITGDPTICSTLYSVLHKTEHHIPRYRPFVRGVPLRMPVSCFLVCSSQWRLVSVKMSQIWGNSTFVQQIGPANKNEIPSVVFITYPLRRKSVYDIWFPCNKGQKCGNGSHAMSASWLMLHRCKRKNSYICYRMSVISITNVWPLLEESIIFSSSEFH